MPYALVCLKASTRMAVWDWMMARGEIWIQDECQVNILLLSAATIIHSRIAARKETWKPFPSPFSVLISRSLARILSITIAHLFSFCFSPRVPIQSIFISPSVPFTAAFISTRSLNLPHPLFYTLLSLFTTSLTNSVSLSPPVCHLSPFSFNLPFFSFPLTAPLPGLYPILLAYFVCFSLFLSQHALVKCTLSPSILLYGPIKFSSLMSIPTLYTWADWTVQVVQGLKQTHAH